jgi:Ca2+-binding RTX toxin-like protein
VIELPEGVTFDMLTTQFGSAFFNNGRFNEYTDTLNLDWLGMTHAMVAFSFEISYDNVVLRFADGTAVSLETLIDNTQANDNIPLLSAYWISDYQALGLTGTDGNDSLIATDNYGWELLGLAGNDVLQGNAGADYLEGGEGDDTLNGGAGSDQYDFSLGSGADEITDLTISGSGDINTVYIGYEVLPEDIIVTSDGSHIILSIDGTDDKLTFKWDRQNGYFVQQVRFDDGTSWDADRLESMAIPFNTAPILAHPVSDQNLVENHPFSFQIPADTFHDTDAGDVLNYTAMRADGSPLPAWLIFNAATGTFSGTPGLNDAGTLALIVTATDQGGLSANSAFNFNIANLIEGSIYNDTIAGSTGNDFISAGAGNDTVNGSDGNDIIIGGTGSDLLAGGVGNDTFLIEGNDSRYDRFEGGAGVDIIQGSAGNDVIRVNNFSGAYTVEKIDGGLGVNTLVGTPNKDRIDLSATQLLNIGSIDGGAGNDTLTGSGGNDVIIGGKGSDLLAGGAGNDTLTGGAGADNFVFDTALNAATNNDTIIDFNVVADTIRLENAIFTKFTTVGVFAAGSFVSGAGAVALDNNDYLIYDTEDGSLYYDADGSGAGAQVEFVSLTAIPALTAANFAII